MNRRMVSLEMLEKSHSIHGMSKEEILLQLLKKEEGFYDAILEAVQIELQAIKEGRSRQYVRELQTRKKGLQACVNEIAQLLTPLKRSWHSRGPKNNERSAMIRKKLACLDQLTNKILQVELWIKKLSASCKKPLSR